MPGPPKSKLSFLKPKNGFPNTSLNGPKEPKGQRRAADVVSKAEVSRDEKGHS